jgi:hypothetical protein
MCGVSLRQTSLLWGVDPGTPSSTSQSPPPARSPVAFGAAYYCHERGPNSGRVTRNRDVSLETSPVQGRSTAATLVLFSEVGLELDPELGDERDGGGSDACDAVDSVASKFSVVVDHEQHKISVLGASQ